MARYGQAFKDRAVARLLPPESSGVAEVAREVGINVQTLERWRADALSGPARDRVWTAAARLEAVIATAALNDFQRSEWCRTQGLYPAELAKWCSSATAALATPEEARASPQQTRVDRKRIKELEREPLRKDKALAETAALLVLSKNCLVAWPRPRDQKHTVVYSEERSASGRELFGGRVPVKKPGPGEASDPAVVAPLW